MTREAGAQDGRLQVVSVDHNLAASVWYREFAEQHLPDRERDVDDLWPRQWLLMFTDGGGGHTVLDCADPDAPSVLKDCFRENIGGPDWGKPICELGQWIRQWHSLDAAWDVPV